MITKLAFLALTLASNTKTLNSGTPVSIEMTSTAKSTQNVVILPIEPAVHAEREVWITAYSSTPDQTDSTPFITASGSRVRDGVIATNLFPFGTKVKIPDLFGDKVFTVEDRMHPRKVNYVDIWVPTREAAIKIGLNYEKILILE